MEENQSVTEPMEQELRPDERQYALFCHLSAFAGLIIPFGSILGPLILWLIKKDESTYIDFHGKEALNFNITMMFIYIACFILIFAVIGIFLLFPAMIFHLVMIVIGTVKANDGVEYRYPLTLRLVS